MRLLEAGEEHNHMARFSDGSEMTEYAIVLGVMSNFLGEFRIKLMDLRGAHMHLTCTLAHVDRHINPI